MIKTAIISGVTGQDGSYLAEYLLDLGYRVIGLRRRVSLFNTARIDHLLGNKNLTLEYADLTDGSSIFDVVRKYEPNEIYNLAAQSHVHVSFDQPEYTANADAIGALRFLNAIKSLNRNIKFYQASTSELFGGVGNTHQNEKTPFHPRSPYAVAKLYAHWATINYREAYDLKACCGILFNHESPRRGEIFVTRKITRALSAIRKGELNTLRLGNLDAIRDWGHAKDYVRAMHLMLQQEEVKDYVIATGIGTTVREFCNLAANYLNLDLEWQGVGVSEFGYSHSLKRRIIEIDTKYYRPSEVDYLIGDARLAKKDLGWVPEITLSDMIREMIDFDLAQ